VSAQVKLAGALGAIHRADRWSAPVTGLVHAVTVAPIPHFSTPAQTRVESPGCARARGAGAPACAFAPGDPPPSLRIGGGPGVRFSLGKGQGG
jgi:hypothetical protein